MSKLEQTFTNYDFDELYNMIKEGVLNGSMSATLEETSSFCEGESRCEVMIFERYSYAGRNRVSMNVTLFQAKKDGTIYLSAVTSGGSQGVFFKINTMGEDTFLDTLLEFLPE